MNIQTMIEQLEFLKTIHGNQIDVVLDDLYTPASRPVDFIAPEPRNNEKGNEIVIVIRD